MNKFVKILILISIFFCGSCSVNNPDQTEKHSETTVECKDPRPQICTREYMPVCATKYTGVNCVTTPCPSTEELTYATGCTACADTKVIHYRSGECEK